MKVWTTKHALTQGIEEKEVEINENNANMVSFKINCITSYYHGEGKEWHKTKEEAIKKAEIMRNSKIKNLEKQIKKLNELKFE